MWSPWIVLSSFRSKPDGRQVYLKDGDLLTIRTALSDAWSWRDSLADAYHRQGPEAKQATVKAEQYRELSLRLFGVLPVEMQIAVENQELPKVSIFDIPVKKEDERGDS